MGYPVLASSSSWFSPNVAAIKRTGITKINIVKDYTPDGTETDTWDASAVKDGSVMAYVNGTELILSAEGNGKIQTAADASYMFGLVSGDYFKVLEEINGLDLLDTSQTTNMRAMFQCCVEVRELDVSGFDMRNVGTTFGMFMSASSYGDMKLTRIYGIEKWKFEKTISSKNMFKLCSELQELNIGAWKVAVSDMSAMFDGCEKIEELDLSGVDNTGATTTGALYNTIRLEKIKVGAAFVFGAGVPNTPSADYIEGADGKWHTIHGDSFTSEALPSGINATYYAIEAAAQEDLAKLKQTFVLVDGYTAVGIGDALREKAGTYGDLKPSEWAETIRSI